MSFGWQDKNIQYKTAWGGGTTTYGALFVEWNSWVISPFIQILKSYPFALAILEEDNLEETNKYRSMSLIQDQMYISFIQ